MTKKQLLAAAIAAALSTGMIAAGTTSVFAADTPPASAEASSKDQATNKAADKEFMKVSEDALMSMRNLRSARLAIFDGRPGAFHCAEIPFVWTTIALLWLALAAAGGEQPVQ